MAENAFTDSEGRVWRPVVTTPVILEAARKLRIELADLMQLKIPVHDLFELLWMACRKQAKEENVNKDQFFELIPVTALKDAFSAFFAATGMAFPQGEVQEGDVPLAGDPGP